MPITSPSSPTQQSKTAEEYQHEVDTRAAKIPGEAGPQSHLLNKLIVELGNMSEDELGVLDMFIDKFMGEGRKEYGSLNLPDDERDLIDFILESVDEGLDHKFYLGCAKLKRITGR